MGRRLKTFSQYGPRSQHTPEELGEALIRHAKYDDVKTIYQLLWRGADINYKDKYGLTALMYACDNGSKRVANLLIDGCDLLFAGKRIKGADLNIRDRVPYGMTALMYATSHNHPDIMDMLIKKGADLSILSDDDRTFIDFASWQTREYLEKYDNQKMILEKCPELFLSFKKHNMIDPEIADDPRFSHLDKAYDLDLL